MLIQTAPRPRMQCSTLPVASRKWVKKPPRKKLSKPLSRDILEATPLRKQSGGLPT